MTFRRQKNTTIRLIDNLAGNGSFPSTIPSNWTGSFTPSITGSVYITAVATGASSSTATVLTMNLRIDGNIVASTSNYSADVRHICLPTIVYDTVLTFTSHTIDITLTGTNPFGDNNDFASIIIEEY